MLLCIIILSHIHVYIYIYATIVGGTPPCVWCLNHNSTWTKRSSACKFHHFDCSPALFTVVVVGTIRTGWSLQLAAAVVETPFLLTRKWLGIIIIIIIIIIIVLVLVIIIPFVGIEMNPIQPWVRHLKIDKPLCRTKPAKPWRLSKLMMPRKQCTTRGSVALHPTEKGTFELNWGFRSPHIMHFNGIVHYKPPIWGYPHFWKPPNDITPNPLLGDFGIFLTHGCKVTAMLQHWAETPPNSWDRIAVRCHAKNVVAVGWDISC